MLKSAYRALMAKATVQSSPSNFKSDPLPKLLIDRFCGEDLPAIDFVHVDLAGSSGCIR
jgi:hypothetical protein